MPKMVFKEDLFFCPILADFKLVKLCLGNYEGKLVREICSKSVCLNSGHEDWYILYNDISYKGVRN